MQLEIDDLKKMLEIAQQTGHLPYVDWENHSISILGYAVETDRIMSDGKPLKYWPVLYTIRLVNNGQEILRSH